MVIPDLLPRVGTTVIASPAEWSASRALVYQAGLF